jgi:DNA primase large subunit
MQRLSAEKKRLSFYLDGSPRSTTHSEMVDAARERLRLHEFVERFKRLPSDIVPLHLGGSVERDVLTHFALRIVAGSIQGRAEEFIATETSLFKMRAERCTEPDILFLFTEEYLSRFQLEIRVREEGERAWVLIDSERINWIGNEKKNQREAEKVRALLRTKECLFVVHFTKLASIPRGVRRGFVEVGRSSIVQLMAKEFGSLLASKTHEIRMLGASDERIAQVGRLIYVPTRCRSLEIQRARKYFPPCISKMLGRVEREGHLKYQDRMTMTTFFKDIGFTLEENLDFWRRALTKVTKEQFDREHRYRIRHVYAQEGSRINYMGYRCTKVIGDTGVNSSTGCPHAGDIENRIRMCTRLLSDATGRRQSPIVSPTEFYRINMNTHEEE